MSRGNLDGSARESYETMAPHYDVFTRAYQYERWTRRLLRCAEEAGLRGERLLDLACGTGLSFLVPLERGMTVTGCDISPAMLAAAREKVGDRAHLLQADMRALPLLGEFDLIWALNDAMNYLLEPEELLATLTGIKRNLAPGGVALFDLNTLVSYRDVWVRDHVRKVDDRRFHWRGAPRELIAGGAFEARIEGDGLPAHTHRQRHFPDPDVRAAIAAAGMCCAEVYGDIEGVMEPGLDERRHSKAVYVCVAREN